MSDLTTLILKIPHLLKKMGAAVVKDADGNDVIKISGKVNDEAAENATAAFLSIGTRTVELGT